MQRLQKNNDVDEHPVGSDAQIPVGTQLPRVACALYYSASPEDSVLEHLDRRQRGA